MSAVPKRTMYRRSVGGKRVASGAALAALMSVLGIEIRVKCRQRGKPCGRPDCPRLESNIVPFWKRSEYEIADTFREAKKSYLTLIKRAHPDTKTGEDSEAAYLNEVWGAIKRIAQHRRIEFE